MFVKLLPISTMSNPKLSRNPYVEFDHTSGQIFLYARKPRPGESLVPVMQLSLLPHESSVIPAPVMKSLALAFRRKRLIIGEV